MLLLLLSSSLHHLRLFLKQTFFVAQVNKVGIPLPGNLPILPSLPIQEDLDRCMFLGVYV